MIQTSYRFNTYPFRSCQTAPKCVMKCKPQGPSRYFLKKLGTKYVTKCKPQGPSMYFWKARD
ncbi:hypothetical protein Hanom_Chr05g00464261 [Helianthus anomalus]